MSNKLFTLFLTLFSFASIVNAQISADFIADTTLICEGVTVNFQDLSTSDTLIIYWAWDFNGDNITDDTTQNPSFTYNTAGQYNVKLTVQNANPEANAKIKTKYITVRKRPVAGVVVDLAKDIFLTDTFNLSSYIYELRSNSTLYDSLQYYYFWDFGDGQFVDSTSSLIYKFQDKGNYNIRMAISAGFACTDSADADITIEDITRVPNVFTPNGDGINDFLTIKTNGIHAYDLIIFNRWGTIVHTATATKLTWDGHTVVGTMVENGVYYYHLSNTITGEHEEGFIHVIN